MSCSFKASVVAPPDVLPAAADGWVACAAPGCVAAGLAPSAVFVGGAFFAVTPVTVGSTVVLVVPHAARANIASSAIAINKPPRFSIRLPFRLLSNGCERAQAPSPPRYAPLRRHFQSRILPRLTGHRGQDSRHGEPIPVGPAQSQSIMAQAEF